MSAIKYHLWTIQHHVVWEKLKQEGSLRADIATSTSYQDWPDSYHWMQSQMRQRLDRYEGGFPWWARVERPDLRKWRHHVRPHENPQVLIELRIPADRILLFSSQAWDYVLMRAYVSYQEQEWDDWYEVLESHGIHIHQNPLPEPWESRMKTSWERIFDLDRLRKEDQWKSSCDWTDAVFEELFLSDVISVKTFSACTCKHNQRTG